MFNAKIFDNFVSKDDCNYLITKAIESDLWENAGHVFWDSRVINYEKILKFDKKSAQIMKDINIQCALKIQKEYNENVYPDTLQIVRWFPEMEQPPHADDMTNTGIVGFEHRAYGSIVYLNEGYSGGHTYYPNFNFEIKPKVGTLAIHPGNPEHLHGVTKIKDGMRYTIASFWTQDKEKIHAHPIY